MKQAEIKGDKLGQHLQMKCPSKRHKKNDHMILLTRGIDPRYWVGECSRCGTKLTVRKEHD